MAKKGTRIILRDGNGEIFAEYEREELKTIDGSSERARIAYSKCAVNAAAAMGMRPKEGELEKYGIKDLPPLSKPAFDKNEPIP